MTRIVCPHCQFAVVYLEGVTFGTLSCPSCGEPLRQLSGATPAVPESGQPAATTAGRPAEAQSTPSPGMVPEPAVAPSLTPAATAGTPAEQLADPRRPVSAWRYLRALAVLVVGGGLGWWLQEVSPAAVDAPRKTLLRVQAPGRHELRLSEPGTYTVFFEYRRAPDAPANVPNQRKKPKFQLTVVSEKTGDELPLNHDNPRPYYWDGDRTGDGICDFVVKDSGVYVLTAGYPPKQDTADDFFRGHTEPEERGPVDLAVGRNFQRAVFLGLAGTVGGLLLSGVSVVVAFVMAWNTTRALSRAHAERRPVVRPAPRARSGRRRPLLVAGAVALLVAGVGGYFLFHDRGNSLGTKALKELARAEEPRTVRSLAFSPDGRRLAVGVRDGALHLLDPATLAAQGTLAGHTSDVVSLAFSPNGKRLASGDSGGAVRIWETDRDPPREYAMVRGDTGSRSVVAFAPDGKTLAVGNSLQVRLWEVSSKPPRQGEPFGGPTVSSFLTCSSVDFSPDRKTLAFSSHANQGAQLWEWSADPPRRRAALNQDDPFATTGVAFSPDGRTLATVSNGRRLRLWDVSVDPPALRHDLDLKSEYPLEAAAFSPDGRLLLVTSSGLRVRLWDVAADPPRPVAEVPGQVAAFAPDGRRLASALSEERGVVYLWDLTSLGGD